MASFFKRLIGEDDEEEAVDNSGYDQSSSSEPEKKPETTKPKPEFILVKPQDMSDLPKIADHLIARKTVILNLELIDRDARRFIDFLSGVAYALNGKSKKVAENTFLIIPGGLEITGDIFDEIENNINM